MKARLLSSTVARLSLNSKCPMSGRCKRLPCSCTQLTDSGHRARTGLGIRLLGAPKRAVAAVVPYSDSFSPLWGRVAVLVFKTFLILRGYRRSSVTAHHLSSVRLIRPAHSRCDQRVLPTLVRSGGTSAPYSGIAPRFPVAVQTECKAKVCIPPAAPAQYL